MPTCFRASRKFRSGFFKAKKIRWIPVTRAREWVAELRKAGGTPKYTEYASIGHNVWDVAFSEPELAEWLFSQPIRQDLIRSDNSSGSRTHRLRNTRLLRRKMKKGRPRIFRSMAKRTRIAEWCASRSSTSGK